MFGYRVLALHMITLNHWFNPTHKYNLVFGSFWPRLARLTLRHVQVGIYNAFISEHMGCHTYLINKSVLY